VITHATRNIKQCDKVIFMAPGGHLAFYGRPDEALTYFGAEDFADIYLKVEREKTPQQWDEEYKQSQYYQQHVASRLQEVNTLVAQARANPTTALQPAQRGQRGGSWLRQFFILASRYLEIIARDKVNLLILLAQAPLLALVLLVLVYNAPDVFAAFPDKYTPQDISEATKMATRGKIVVFLLTLFSLMCGTISAVREIIKELPIYKRERTVNLGVFPYVLSKFAVLALVSAFQTGVFVAIVFSKLKPPGGVEDFHVLVFLTLFLVNLAGVAMGLAVSAWVTNQNVAIAMLPLVLLTQIVLSGALLPLEGLKFLSSLTIMKFGFEMLGKATELWKVLPQKAMAGIPEQLLKTGVDYKETFNVTFWPHAAALGVFVVFFFVMACMLQRAKDNKRE
jgi:hypothetical protein